MPNSDRSSGFEERYRLPDDGNSTQRTPKKSKPSPQKTPRSGSAKRKPSTPSRLSVHNQPPTSRPPLQPTRKRNRFRPGVKALREIKKLQQTTDLCIRKLPFSRLVREIQSRQNRRITHWQAAALSALQEATESYLIRFLSDCNEAAIFARRVTIMQRDCQFINRLRSRSGQRF